MKTLKKRLYAEITKRYMAGCSNYNSVDVRRSCRSKAQARAVFAKYGVPHAEGEIYLSPWKIQQFAREHGFPLCVKPNVSGFSRGSYFPINSHKELWKATLLAKLWWPKTVVEYYLLGKNYRVLCTPDDVPSIIQRYAPFVDGNGSDSIETLIDEENRVRAEMQLHPVIYPIRKSPEVTTYLKKQNLNFQSVPAQGQRVYLFNRVALAPGGVVETIDRATVPRVNIELFQSIVENFDARVLGIDVIFEKGIDVPYTDQRCIFLEVNSRPYMRMHDHPRYGVVDDLSGFYQVMDQLEVAGADTF